MFQSSAESDQNKCNPVGTVTVLIPTHFVWPYGGTRVFLSGSFTGWSEHIPMSPMEGCPTVFQAICNLTPGFHEYKFNVDGEWRHDEHQPFANGSYGVVNTRFLARDDMVPVMLNSAAPGRTNMDVDDTTFVRMPTLSDAICHGAVPRVSKADIEVSRSRISLFLSQHTAYELLPDSGKVVALDVNLPVKQAFHVLYEQGIPLAPLWDFSKSQFVGVLSAIDFILILRELGTLGSNLTEEELETHTILAWKDGKARMNGHIDNNGRMSKRGLVHGGPYDSLKDVALKLLLNKISTIPIIHSSSPDGSSPQLLHLASLSGILKCICRHFKHSSSALPILHQPICSIPLGTWVPKIGESNRPFSMLKQHDSLGAALSLLVQAEVSCVPIVDANNSLIDVYSRSNITSLAKDRVYAHIHLDEMSIYQALQLEQDANSSHGTFSAQTCHMCLPSDPLQKVMDRLSNPGVRRLVIVEAGSKRVEGIITLSDVFRFLLG